MSERLAVFLLRHRRAVLGALLAATLGLGAFAPRVGVDNSVDVWFVADDPALASYRAFQQTFGNDEVAVVAVTDPAGIWRADTLNRLHAAATAISKIDGVHQVLGVPTARVLSAPGDALDARPAMTGPVDAPQAVAVRQAIESDRVLAHRLVKANGTIALLYVQMARLGEIDARRPAILDAIHVANRATLGDLSVDVVGIGVIYDALNRLSQTEGNLLMGLAFLVIFALLWVLLRSWGAVLLAIAVVASAALMTRGLAGLLGKNDNMVTMTLPVLILFLGVAECIHFLRHRAGHPDESPEKVLARLIGPCFTTSITTVVGFGALVTAKMAVIRDFGVLAAAGLSFAFICTIGYCAFAFGSPRFQAGRTDGRTSRFIARVAASAARFSSERKLAILGVTLLLLLAMAYGVTRLEVDTYSLGFLPPSHPVREATERLERDAGPFTPLELTFAAPKAEALATRPELLRGLAAFQAEAARDPDVGDAFSLADVIARVDQVMSGDATQFQVPDDEQKLAQCVESYKSAPGQQLRDLADADLRTARVTLAVKALSAKGYAELITRLTALAKRHVPSDVVIAPSGYLPLYVTMMGYVVDSQVDSFGASFVVVFLLIGLLFRSVRLTALAVPSNLLPLVAVLGLMGYAGIRLDVATVTIAAILMGIVVDDTIHYLHALREALERGETLEGATAYAGRETGAAIVMTSVVFFLGFLVLTVASIKSIVYFGLLSALSIAFALLCDVLMLPALVLTLRPRLVRESGPVIRDDGVG